VTVDADEHADPPTGRAALDRAADPAAGDHRRGARDQTRPGADQPLQGGVHLSVFAACLVLAVNP
jgi:hypothetical protein